MLSFYFLHEEEIFRLIDNGKNFFVKKKFMDSESYAKICRVIVELLTIFFYCF